MVNRHLPEGDAHEASDDQWLADEDVEYAADARKRMKRTTRAARKRSRSVVTEVGIFCIGVGLLVMVAGIAMWSTGPDNPRLFGMPRYLTFGIPITAVGLINTFCGALAIVVRSSWSIILCICAGAMICVTYHVLMFGAGVGVGCNCLSIIMYAIPAGLFLRGREAMAEISQLAAARSRADNVGTLPRRRRVQE